MKPLSIKLSPGSDLRYVIEEIGRKESSSGFVLSIVGNLSKACFQCPGRSQPTVLEGNLEIISLSGTFDPTGVHLHLSISDSDCQVWGGHLEPGTLIYKGADILLGLVPQQISTPTSLPESNESRKSRIEIVILPNCPWSKRAIKILTNLQIPHDVKTIISDQDYEEFKIRSDFTTFPQIFIDGQLLGGYDELSELHSSGKLQEFK